MSHDADPRVALLAVWSWAPGAADRRFPALVLPEWRRRRVPARRVQASSNVQHPTGAGSLPSARYRGVPAFARRRRNHPAVRPSRVRNGTQRVEGRRRRERRGQRASEQSRRCYQALGETQKALSHYTDALSLSRSAKDARSEGETLAGLAYLQFYCGDTQKALDNATTALELNQAAGNPPGEARALRVMGEAVLQHGRHVQERGMIQEQALAQWRALADARGEAQSLGGGRLHLSDAQ